MKLKHFILLVLLPIHTNILAQSFSINTNGNQADPSAIFDITSTSKGVLIPRLNSLDRNAIINPAQGLVIYNTDDSCFNFYNGSLWINLCHSYTYSIAPVIKGFVSDTTWTKPAGLKYIIVEVVGGGGGGGGCYSYGGGAGAGGGYSKKIISANSLPASVGIIVGLGGSGGAAQTAGNSGGTSSFGLYCSATGGEGGKAQTTLINETDGSNPGVGIGGDLNFSGQGSGGATGSAAPLYVGGSSIFSGGAASRAYTSGTSGISATSYGSGGSGGACQPILNRSGGNGSSGIVIITEYY